MNIWDLYGFMDVQIVWVHRFQHHNLHYTYYQNILCFDTYIYIIWYDTVTVPMGTYIVALIASIP